MFPIRRILIVCLCVAVLAACGNKGPLTRAPAEPPPAPAAATEPAPPDLR